MLASAAHAGNGPEPRTEIDWSGAACMTIVDRSEDAVAHLDYGIPMEDTELTADEVEDSRRFQFFGFCRALDPQSDLPRWITWADVERAREVGIAPPRVNASNVMETDREWAGCWHRINADDDRRPITYAEAAQGIDWDTTDLAPGNYVIEGYTWEPPLNIWSSRAGVIKVVDDPDPALSEPAVAVTNTEEVIDQSETVTLEGCVSAEEGSTLTLSWGVPAGEVTWHPFVEDEAVTGESFAVEFGPPEQAVGLGVMIRVDITDPSGRSYTHYMRDLVYVLGDPYPPECEGNVFGGGGCDGTSSSGGSETGDVDATSTGAATSTGTGPGQGAGEDSDGGNQADADTGGCAGCRTQNPDPWTGSGLLLLALAGLRRRR